MSKRAGVSAAKSGLHINLLRRGTLCYIRNYMDSGIYIACFYLAKEIRIKVGRLGRFDFDAGFYFYVGRARKNLTARLDRHSRKIKTRRWHIDYLSSIADMLGAIIICEQNQTECEIAAELRARFTLAVRGFGSSDCRCKGHLYYAKAFPEL